MLTEWFKERITNGIDGSPLPSGLAVAVLLGTPPAVEGARRGLYGRGHDRHGFARRGHPGHGGHAFGHACPFGHPRSFRHGGRVSLALVLLFCVFCTTTRAAEGDAERRRSRWAAEIRRVLAPGALEAIVAPPAVPAAQATIDPSEPVVGVSVDGESRAYSVHLLNSHEVVNDVVGGQPIVVVWCPLANLAVVYSRRLEHADPTDADGEQEEPDRVLIFEASGSLLKNTVVMLDYETDSLWAAISGEALTGPVAGRRLDTVPSAQKIAWGSWLEMHPETTLAVHRGVQSPGVDSYAAYHRSRLRTGIHPPVDRDERLSPKEMVIALDIGGRRRAYPFSLFGDTKVVSHVLNGVPLLLYRDEATQHTAVYSRRVRGEHDLTLHFGRLETESFYRDKVDTITDRRTSTEWDLRTGVAVAGPLEGTRLTPVPFASVYWFVWNDYHPDAGLHGRRPRGR